MNTRKSSRSRAARILRMGRFLSSPMARAGMRHAVRHALLQHGDTDPHLVEEWAYSALMRHVGEDVKARARVERLSLEIARAFNAGRREGAYEAACEIGRILTGDLRTV